MVNRSTSGPNQVENKLLSLTKTADQDTVYVPQQRVNAFHWLDL